jgi:hypothetical protein
MDEYIYNAKRGWVNIREAYSPFILSKKQNDSTPSYISTTKEYESDYSPKYSLNRELRYGDKYNVPPTGPVDKTKGLNLSEFLPSGEAEDVILSLSESFKNLKRNINDKKIDGDMRQLMTVFAAINNLTRTIDISLSRELKRITPSTSMSTALRYISNSIAVLANLLQDKADVNLFSRRYRGDIASINAQMNRYVRETAKYRN